MDTRIIGGKIAQARKAKRMSQAQLGQQLFISPQAVGKWERGESMPDITTFNRLAATLGVELNYFLDNEATTITPAKVPVTPAEKEAAPSAERQVQIDLRATNLQEHDFAGVTLHKGKFRTSSLRKANFAGADLTGSSFEILDAQGANFDGANLTDCEFSITDLTDASFHETILVRTKLHMSGHGAKFTDVMLVEVHFIKADLSKTRFDNCIFKGVDFNHCDLRGLNFEGQTLAGVWFNKSALKDVSFCGATLRNVSFTLPFSLTNRSHLDFKTIRFEGSTMDKLTYTALKGLHVADLSKVTVI
ncbi:pentapeptide repeat-containing protein [Chitinophaga qingshengii]|uniref:Pentapeptide repeat-containing protein n=1 Tax=Chitinophaga qingshengii TaxID=1569794 RepID=A0ABR7TWT6_9BACT|nr:pentapeptide repeat-containing protein [Chitinophaga qingshengii]MBC9934940.1 pentapeptide repeat-containing protein [Chitinophaga qingshengii]